MKSYYRFMRVTKKGAILQGKYADNPRLCLIRDHLNYKMNTDPEIREAISRSFRESGKPCQWCEYCYELKFETCLECKRSFVYGNNVSE